MQLNGTNGSVIMAASEPPEPPPRNPDKINASLKQLSDTKSTKTLDTCERTENNNKPLKSILSLDNSKTTTMGTKEVKSSEAAKTVENGRKLAANMGTSAVTTLSPTALAASTQADQNARISPKNLSPVSDGLMNGGSSGGNSSKSTNSSPLGGSGGITPSGSSGNDGNSSAAKNRSPTDGVRNINNNQDNGNANEETATVKANFAEKKSPASDGKAPITTIRNDSIRGSRKSTDGDNNVNNIENDGDSTQNQRLRMENDRLKTEICRLRSMLENSPDGAVGGIDISDSNSVGASSTDGNGVVGADRLEAELKSARQQIANLKIERRKLKSDKVDLLAHVKQLCASLQDKEQELRDFIRNFEHRMRENESNATKVTSDRERERWSLLKHAREEAERSIALAAQLNTRDMQLKRVQEQLQEARRQLSGCMSDQESVLSFAPLTPPSGMMNHLGGPSTSYGTSGMASLSAGERGSCSADSGLRGSSDRESAAGDLNLSDGPCDNGGPCITIDSDSISLVSSHHIYPYGGTPKERSPTLSPLNVGAFNRSIDNGALSRSVEQIGSPVDSEGGQSYLMHQQIVQRRVPSMKSGTSTLGGRSSHRSSGGGGTWGSISRVFARSRNRNKNPIAQLENEESAAYHPQWSPLTEESYADKLRLLREASAMPIERWRASQVLAWIEVALGMPQYSSRCAENVKSGKVLLELNDGELESGLGLTHPMHRKKIRLAIEEQRRPELVRYPTIVQLGHTWVASEWLPDIGLPQYAEAFLHSLVDARMLDTLSKKELEKFLNVTRKFHQASIVHGIHVLRILKYDRQALAMRRMQSENSDSDPIVWTNQRFIRWARSIDLGEYADNLKDSGVHGGLVVLEPSFSGETMATALGIPQSKNIIRRHLCAEFDALILPARGTLGQGIRSGGAVVPITGPGGLQTQTADRRSSASLRGSLSKAFGFNTTSKSKRNESKMGNSTSPTPSYSSLSSENGLYASVGVIPPPLPCNGPPTMLPHHQQQQQQHYQRPHRHREGEAEYQKYMLTARADSLANEHQQYHSIITPPSGSGSSSSPPPPSHRISAPPMDTNSTLPRYSDHRRVKSISNIEALAVTP